METDPSENRRGGGDNNHLSSPPCILVSNTTSNRFEGQTCCLPSNKIYATSLPDFCTTGIFRPQSASPQTSDPPWALCRACHMRLSLQHGLSMAIFSNFAGANTEKVIFQAPETINVPNTSPNLGDLRLDMLTPDHWSKRIDLPASFPAPASPFGSPTWLLLKNLTQDQRYELRVCWAATVRCFTLCSSSSHH